MTKIETVVKHWNSNEFSSAEKRIMAQGAGLPAPARISQNRHWWMLSEDERNALQPIVESKL